MSTLLKNLLIALGITALLILVYYFIPKNDEEFDTTLISDTPSVALEIEKILADTQRIDSIEIDAHDDILASQQFTSLVDRRIEIPDVATGRANPFAPVQ